MKYFLYSILSLFLIVVACSSQEGLSQYDDIQIVFGSGGGFSGQEMQYTLDNSGNITLYDNLSKKTTEVTKIKKKKTKTTFDELDTMNELMMDFNHPGNMYYFVKRVKGTKEEKIVWGDNTHQAPAEIQEYYNLLMSYVNESKKK